MPKQAKISRDDILAAALDLVREAGPEALGARTLARRLGTSTQPVFSHFSFMKELEAGTLRAANALYERRVSAALSVADRPYRAAGLAYIAFAREEPRLFRWLFMRDRTGEDDRPTDDEVGPILSLLQAKFGFTREEALRFHAEMWVVVHGMATMIATGYYSWDEATVSALLTDLYKGLLQRYGKEF